MSKIPAKLEQIRDLLASEGRTERMQMLIDLGKKFKEVPPEIAERPFADEHKVPGCESEAYVWATDHPEGGVKFYFAVENPQGISAKASAVILDRGLSGAPLDEILAVDPAIMNEFFGGELTMGKNLGLSNLLGMCQHAAKQRLATHG